MYRTYGVLNVVAHPHPEGVYRKVFEQASDNEPVKFRGDRYATISRITASVDGVFRGRLATWTEIDPNAPSVDKSSLQEMSLQEAGIELPDNIGLNSAIFYFSFREDDHVLYIELANDEGRSISASVAQRAFQKVLSAASADLVDELNVFIKTRADAVEYALGLASLRKIEIDLHLPNPDDLGPEHAKALEMLAQMKSNRMQATFTKAKGEPTLILLPEWRAAAELSQDNGSVTTYGKDEYGDKKERSTKEMPAEVVEEIAPEDSSFSVVGRVAVERRDLGSPDEV